MQLGYFLLIGFPIFEVFRIKKEPQSVLCESLSVMNVNSNGVEKNEYQTLPTQTGRVF